MHKELELNPDHRYNFECLISSQKSRSGSGDNFEVAMRKTRSELSLIVRKLDLAFRRQEEGITLKAYSRDRRDSTNISFQKTSKNVKVVTMNSEARLFFFG